MIPAPAAFAARPEASRGRLHPEPESPGRSAFQRDRDRIIHSTAFRRLQYKTQVFVYHEGDHYRTRLTHSLEVAQIARSLARGLGLNEDLAEALALAHDLGHTPFGHAGEEALDGAMKAYGGFAHNDQTLRILTSLERRYADFDGLNLTWETLEGTVKHNGPLRQPYSETVAALSDDIAYDNHDIDDGFRAGLFSLDELREVPLIGEAIKEVTRTNRKLEDSRVIHEAVRRLIDRMVNDVLAETRARISGAKVQSPDGVRAQKGAMVSFSEALRAQEKGLREFLHQRMYRHHRVTRMTSKARKVVAELFARFMREPDSLPAEWRAQVEGKDQRTRARIVADYIAGMTDRFALDEHKRLFDPGHAS